MVGSEMILAGRGAAKAIPWVEIRCLEKQVDKQPKQGTTVMLRLWRS